MTTSVIKQRVIEKFIITEFVKGNLNSKEAVDVMMNLIQRKLNLSVDQAARFLKNAIGINA